MRLTIVGKEDERILRVFEVTDIQFGSGMSAREDSVKQILIPYLLAGTEEYRLLGFFPEHEEIRMDNKKIYPIGNITHRVMSGETLASIVRDFYPKGIN